ncbi:hypothetical protein BGZ57DRAFT_858600 [Hyaloscypha finlandica]|nr:hypothetical protein F5882DRAFT_387582 [Hyaloscypha sp. PMI_1271]KAH8760029.1 hypothetical protein BGZ57DRAFT_858600 [Hyaloscypha finlandica]
MARLALEDTSWVAEHLPNWQRAIYTVDDPSALLHTSTNKGHESLAYLTYIISNYHSLPSTLVFLHAHRSGRERGWHIDAWDWDNVRSMKSLNLSYVQESGYVNLRCNWKPGCRSKDIKPNRHVSKQLWIDVLGSGSNGTEDEVPEIVGQPCCAQFAVSRLQVMKRPLEDYIRYRQWVLDTELDDDESGRVMEFLWHVIFGKEPLFCPEPSTCYCKVYGRCD